MRPTAQSSRTGKETDMLPFDTVLTARKAIAERKISAVELTQAALDRIAKHDGQIKAFNSTCPEVALAQAKAVDEGKRHGILAGVPIALKDNLCTTFGTTTCSSRMLQNFKAPYDATVVRMLDDAGRYSSARPTWMSLRWARPLKTAPSGRRVTRGIRSACRGDLQVARRPPWRPGCAARR